MFVDEFGAGSSPGVLDRGDGSRDRSRRRVGGNEDAGLQHRPERRESVAQPPSVTLTPDELAKVKAKHATAALVFHYGGNDWSNAQDAALKAQFAAEGIEVIAVTDAGFKPEKQVADIETVMAKKPDIIVSIPVDAVATAAAYKAAADKGVKLVFMDNVPKGFTAGKEYVSSVSADNYGNGVAAAHLMAKALGGKGEIGLVFHAADFFVTRQRYDGFKKTILEDYPDIKIVAEQGIGGPDFSGDAEKAAGAILTEHPTHQRDLGGLGRSRRRRDGGGARGRARRSHRRQRRPRRECRDRDGQGRVHQGHRVAASL